MRHSRARFIRLLAAVLPAVVYFEAAAVASAGAEQDRFGEADVEAFRAPPPEVHPETWFHFIGGNVAAAGITADLEAIAAAGIRGVQLFHGQFGGAWPGVAPQIQCLSETWDDLVRHVAEECRRLGLRFTMQNCPGWAMAGGPWITPERSMRHLVWSRTSVSGGSKAVVALPRPQPSNEDWRDYRDVAVVAFPTPDGDTGNTLRPESVRGNRPDLPWLQCLADPDGAKIVLKPGAEPVWVEAVFAEEVVLRTLELPPVQTFNHAWSYDPGVTVTVHAVLPDGMRQVARHALPPSNWQGNKPISLACSETPSRVYRMTIDHAHNMTLSFIRLHSGARKTNWEAEAAWVLRGLDRAPPPRQAQSAWVDPDRRLDLSDRVDHEGTLRWEAPPGDWTVLRWGHVNTGKRNGPAPPEATGWECDKLSPAGAEAHFAGYIGRLTAEDGPLSDGLLQGMLLDSWECETQTWTPGLEDAFEQLYGYPLRPWFPALAGYVIRDPETTTRFLRDWRAAINHRVVEHFFGRMAALGHERGLSIAFETAAGDVFPGDILEYYKHADVPMCEFWHPRSEAYVGSFEFKPVKPCVSAARMYGKPRVAAEAFTSFELSWNEHPGALKSIADMHLAEGVTHLVFHTYTHNPRTDFLPPGTSFGSGIGTPFLRGQTWWPHMSEFTAYLARCGYLLERGRPVSDVLWYLGDEQDHKPRQDAPFPPGHQYDYCNPDALLNRLSVRDGMWATPEGLRYRALWLRDCPRMLPDTLERILALVREGAVVIGERPRGAATLSGGSQADARVHAAADALWGAKGAAGGIRRVGGGRVISGLSIGDALAALDINPDLEGDGVLWTHRRTDGADWYFVAAAEPGGFSGTIRFRSAGEVEFWDPLTGEVTPARGVRQDGDVSLVPLDLPASGSMFVVFRAGDETASGHPAPAPRAMRGMQLDGPWRLAFPAGWGAPATAPVQRLISWTEMDLPAEARAFSGTATYTAEFSLESMPAGGSRVELDLGRVEVIAAVRVNGDPVGTVWCPPYRLNITRAIKPGINRLAVDVTSTWFNRLVYDAGLEEAARKTWTIHGPPRDAALVPAGLLGPVTVHMAEPLAAAEGDERP